MDRTIAECHGTKDMSKEEVGKRKRIAYNWINEAVKTNVVKNYVTDIAHDTVFILTTSFPYYLVAIHVSGSHIIGALEKPTSKDKIIERHLDSPNKWYILSIEEETIEELK